MNILYCASEALPFAMSGGLGDVHCERGSSVTAGRILSDMGKKRQKQRARVDAVAASVILQSYLDYLALGGRA